MALISEGAPGTVRRLQNHGACRAPKGPGSLGVVSAVSIHNVATNFLERIKLVDNE